MKMTWIRTTIWSAAALAITSAAAWAQTREAVEIPFSFRVNGTEMPAGTYTIQRALTNVNYVLVLSGPGTQKMLSAARTDSKDPGQGRLIFKCTDSTGCTLVKIWRPNGDGLSFREPKLSKAEQERLAVVPMRELKAE